MGGQACVFYGAAEFSRDLDILILVDPENLDCLRQSLEILAAKPIAVPVLDAAYLASGHAIHFRCGAEGVAGLRIDVMSRLRRVDEFAKLWDRRTTIEVDGEMGDLMALADLVAAKKTQRDKDWPMIRRLVEQDYFSSTDQASPQRGEFWLRELRTPELLIAVAIQHPEAARAIAQNRPAVQSATRGDSAAVTAALQEEERVERLNDRLYWEPLKRELETLRREAREAKAP